MAFERMTSTGAALSARAYGETLERATNSAPWRLDHVVNGRFLSQPLTGVQRYAFEVVKALDDLIAAQGGGADLMAPGAASTPAYKAFRVENGAWTSGYLWEQVELPMRARRPLLSLCNLGPLAASEQILCIHDVNVFQSPESYSAGFGRLYRRLLPLLARRAARVTTVSQASQRALCELFSLERADVAVLPNGSEHVSRWRPERSRLSVSGFRPYVLLIGSLARHKNIGRVLALAEALEAKGIDIVVAGGSAPVFASMSRRPAANVHVLGRVDDDDLACLFANALCLAFPSRFEGFGLPLVEAMALGRPVVASPIASSLEVCGDAALYAGADDPDAWLAAIVRLAGSANLRAELTERGRLRARAYSWRETAQGYLDLTRGERP